LSNVSTEIAMFRLPIQQHLALAVLGMLASLCTLALAVLAPLAA
jgi:hypothetical protein